MTEWLSASKKKNFLLTKADRGRAVSTLYEVRDDIFGLDNGYTY
jgi:hypothetical protein